MIRSQLTVLVVILTNLVCRSSIAQDLKGKQDRPPSATAAVVDPARDLGTWEGWGSSLAWWARAIGGTRNADYYADLIYTKKVTDGYPGLGLNIVRYNIGGGGIDQRKENKGPKLQWQMDIHGYWTDSNNSHPANWNWSADLN